MTSQSQAGGAAIGVWLRMRLRYPDLETFVERFAVNVSRGGMFIASPKPRPVGSLVRFEYQLHDRRPALSGEGQVVWAREQDPAAGGRAAGMGIRFTRLDPGSEAVVEQMLAHKRRLTQQGLEADAAARAARDAPEEVSAGLEATAQPQVRPATVASQVGPQPTSSAAEGRAEGRGYPEALAAEPAVARAPHAPPPSPVPAAASSPEPPVALAPGPVLAASVASSAVPSSLAPSAPTVKPVSLALSAAGYPARSASWSTPSRLEDAAPELGPDALSLSCELQEILRQSGLGPEDLDRARRFAVGFCAPGSDPEPQLRELMPPLPARPLPARHTLHAQLERWLAGSLAAGHRSQVARSGGALSPSALEAGLAIAPPSRVAPVSDQVLEEAKSAAGPGSDGWLGEGLEVPLDDLEAPPTLIGEPRLTPSEGSQRRDSVRISAGSAAAAAPAARPAATEDDMDLLHLASLARTAQRQAELPRPSQRLPLDVAALFDEGPTDVGQSPGDSLPRWAGVTAAAAGRAIRPGVEEAETTMPDGPVGVGHGVAGGAALAGSSGKPATSPAHGGQEGSQGGTADGPAAEARTEPPTEQPTDPGKPRRRPLFSSMKKRLLGK